MKPLSSFKSCFILLFIFLCCKPGAVSAQENKVHFYDVITEDSVVMYFLNGGRFCKKECHEFKRYVRIADNGDFTGDFYDSSATGHLLAKGRYENGLKNGFFYVAIPEHGLYSEGNFRNNVPVGTWQYYYANGRPERKLVFSETDTLLVEFFDSNGAQLVKDGNGFYKGRVHVPQSKFHNHTIASGKIENGKATGDWTSVISGAAYNKETLNNGILVSGRTSGSRPYEYDDQTVITNFLLETHIEKLEEFNISEYCPGVRYDVSGGEVKEQPKQSKPISLDNFYYSLNEDVSRVIQADIKDQNYGDYLYGENRLTVKFKINDKGIPADITKISNWGGQFVDIVTRNLKAHTKFNNKGGELYFHLVVNKNNGNILQYKYNFSASDDR